jgi:RNA 2',3'-cyclic 3'-phosphodiesterase
MRLFVGIDLPWELREELARLRASLPGARWVPEENLHLTLRFIGEVDPNQAEDIDVALHGLRGKRFPLALSGIGTHNRNGRETQMWAGVEKSDALEHLQAKIETAVQRAGQKPERRRFLPHVTLARLDNLIDGRLAAYVQAHNLFRTRPVEINHVTLFSSLLGKEASVYTAEVEYKLA